jgi:hypothetical protein
MTDKWQLDQWRELECVSNPNTKARSIVVSGYCNGTYQSYVVSFKNTKEMMLFKLKHSNYFVSYQSSWKLITLFSKRVRHTQGPTP